MSDTDFLMTALGNGIGYPFCVFDRQESVAVCNEEFERLLGVRGMRGQTLKEIFEPTEFAPLVPGIRQGLTGEVPTPLTVAIDGYPVRQYQAVVKPIVRDGEVVYAVITLADVTAKMESLAFALKMSEFYDRVFDEMPQAYFMFDSHFAILRANRAATALFGYSSIEFLGLKLTRLLIFAGKDIIENRLEKFKGANGGTLRLGVDEEIQGIRQDASTFPLRLSLIQSDHSELRTYSAVVLDLSADREHERLSLEEEKKQQVAMRNEALGKLAGKFAHDMNNVLAVIGGFSEIMALAPREQDLESIGEILEGVRRAAALTARILAYTGRQQMETYPLQLNLFVQEKAWQWQDALGSAISLNLQLSETNNVANADEKLLVQVVFSLLANSREALDGDGQVTLGVRQTHVDADFLKERGIENRVGNFIELYVTDNGPGVATDKLGMIFEPYFSTKDPSKSTGLGLAVVSGILKQHHGFILCDSVPGKQTTMRVFLPAFEGEAEAPEPDEIIPEIHPPDFTVLVVDDEESILRILETSLTRHGFKVFTALDGRKALDFIESYDGEIHLLISDVIMPEVTGLELAETVLQIYPDLPIVFITGYSNQIIDKNPSLRHFRLLKKPFSHDEVIHVAVREIALRRPRKSVNDSALPE